MNNKKGRLIVIAAPSGTGKGTILDYMKQQRPEINTSISVTTRQPRVDELHGVSYYFVSRERFLEMIEDDEFLEYAEYIGEYYGTPKKPIYDLVEAGQDVILEIEVQGAKQILSLDYDILAILIVPPDMEELERRLRGRGTDTQQQLTARLERAKEELAQSSLFTHIVVNDDYIRAAMEIMDILDA
ncbi:MAG: guanylate kinase [Oscillospiraceae bacterium]|nr:guanylate kinase [Oscillospiraceae bacterium]